MNSKISSHVGIRRAILNSDQLAATEVDTSQTGTISKQKNHNILSTSTGVSLCEIQQLIGKSALCEEQANVLLRTLGYPEIAGYLVLTYIFNVEVDLMPKHEMRALLIAMIHSVVLERPLFDVVNGVHAERAHFIDDERFEKFRELLSHKILPLIKERNFQSIASTMLTDVIQAYPSFDNKTRGLLETLVHEAADTGKSLNEINNRNQLSMGGEPDYYTPQEKRGVDGEPDAIDRAVNKFIEDLRSNKHAIHPTKYETMLKMFEDRCYDTIGIKELGSILFADGDEPERSIHMKISKLNSRLRDYGLQIERSSNYSLRRVDTGTTHHKPEKSGN